VSRYRMLPVEDVATDGLVGLIVVVAVVLVGGGIWVLVQTISLLIRVIRHSHDQVALRLSLGLFGVFAAAVVVTGGRYPTIDTLALIAFAALTVVAFVLDQGARSNKPRPADLDTVMTSPWWDD